MEVEMAETAISDFFGGAAALGGLRLPPPSLRSWKTTKKLNNNQLMGGNVWGASWECRGSRK